MVSFKKIFLVLLIVLFVCLSFLDIYTVVDSYFSFRTNITINFMDPDGSALPSVTLCGQKALFVNDQFFTEKFGHSADRPIGMEDVNTINGFFDDMSPKEQFEALYSIKELKELIEWQSIDGFVALSSTQSWSGIDVQISINADLYCFTLNNNPALVYEVNGQEINPIMTFRMNIKVPEVMVFIHTWAEPPFDIKDQAYTTVSLDQNKVTNLHHDATNFHLLPAPYDTNCEDYDRRGPGSYRQMYINYITRKLMNQLSCLPNHYLIEPGQYVKICSGDISYKKIQHSAVENASLFLKQDCFLQYYSISQDKGFVIPKDNSTESHKINVYPATLLKELTAYPDITIYELFEAVTEEVSWWLVIVLVFLMISIQTEKLLFKKDSMELI